MSKKLFFAIVAMIAIMLVSVLPTMAAEEFEQVSMADFEALTGLKIHADPNLQYPNSFTLSGSPKEDVTGLEILVDDYSKNEEWQSVVLGQPYDVSNVCSGQVDYRAVLSEGRKIQTGASFWHENCGENPPADHSYSVSVTTACEPPTYSIHISGPEVVPQDLSGLLSNADQTVPFTVHFTDGTTKDDTQKVPAFDAEKCGGTTTTTHDKPKTDGPQMINCEWSTPIQSELKFWVYWNSGNGMYHNIVDQSEWSTLGQNGQEFGRLDEKIGQIGRTLTVFAFAHKFVGGTFSIWIENTGLFTTFSVVSNKEVTDRAEFGWDLTGKCQSTVTSNGGSSAGKVNLVAANPKYAAIRLLVARVTANDDPGMDLYTNGFKILDSYVLANGKRVENLSFTDSKFYTGWKTGFYTYLPAFGEKAEIVVKFADGTKTFTITRTIEVADPSDVHAGNSLMRANFVGSNKDGSVQMKWFPGNSVEELYKRSEFDGTLKQFKDLWNKANPSHTGLDRELPKSILDKCGSTPATWFD